MHTHTHRARSHTHTHTHTRAHALPASLVAAATISEPSPAEREPKPEREQEGNGAGECGPGEELRADCAPGTVSMAGPRDRGGAGAAGAQAREPGCLCLPAAPRARPLIGREPQGPRVGGGVLGARPLWEGARAELQGGALGTPVRDRALARWAAPPNPRVSREPRRLGATLRVGGEDGGSLVVELRPSFLEERGRNGAGARVVPPGGPMGASPPPHQRSRRLSGTPVQPHGAALEPLRALDPWTPPGSGTATASRSQGREVIFAARLRTRV